MGDWDKLDDDLKRYLENISMNYYERRARNKKRINPNLSYATKNDQNKVFPNPIPYEPKKADPNNEEYVQGYLDEYLQIPRQLINVSTIMDDDYSDQSGSVEWDYNDNYMRDIGNLDKSKNGQTLHPIPPEISSVDAYSFLYNSGYERSQTIKLEDWRNHVLQKNAILHLNRNEWGSYDGEYEETGDVYVSFDELYWMFYNGGICRLDLNTLDMVQYFPRETEDFKEYEYGKNQRSISDHNDNIKELDKYHSLAEKHNVGFFDDDLFEDDLQSSSQKKPNPRAFCSPDYNVVFSS